jgi:hypothetical protein
MNAQGTRIFASLARIEQGLAKLEQLLNSPRAVFKNERPGDQEQARVMLAGLGALARYRQEKPQ